MKYYKNINTLLFLTLFFFAQISLSISQSEISVRFADPVIDYETFELCINIEVQAQEANLFLEELKIRFYTDNSIMTFKELTELNPAYLLTGAETINTVSGVGESFFGLNGEAVYVYDDLMSIDNNLNEEKIIATSPNWTQVVQACFNATDPNKFYSATNKICPPIIWNQDPQNLAVPSNNYLQVLLLDPAGGPSIEVEEIIQHANWADFAPDISLGPCAEARAPLADEEDRIPHIGGGVINPISDLSTEHPKANLLSDIALSPNPANDFIRLDLAKNDGSNASIEIYHSNGALVEGQRIALTSDEKVSYTIDITKLQAGVYFLKISNKHSVQTLRFIKQ